MEVGWWGKDTFKTSRRALPTWLFTRNHWGILNSLHLAVVWNNSFGGWFVWFGVVTHWVGSLISGMLAVVSVTGQVRWVFAERCCLGCQEAFCDHLCHLHIKVKQGPPRSTHGPWGNSTQRRTVLASGPGSAKETKGHHKKHGAYRNCPFLSFWGTFGTDVEQEHREGVGGVCAAHARTKRVLRKMNSYWCEAYLFSPILLRFSCCCCKALKSRKYPGEGSALLTHQLDQVGKPGPLWKHYEWWEISLLM